MTVPIKRFLKRVITFYHSDNFYLAHLAIFMLLAWWLFSK